METAYRTIAKHHVNLKDAIVCAECRKGMILGLMNAGNAMRIRYLMVVCALYKVSLGQMEWKASFQ